MELQNTHTQQEPRESADLVSRLIEIIDSVIRPLGYETVHIEIQVHRQKTLRIFIDRLESSGTPIGIEDCVKVTRALDEPLDQKPELEALFKGSYELEVSSPGVDRPLRQARDFERFAGQQVRIHVFRPLTVEEMESPEHQRKNPKQKNFLGTLVGLREGKVRLSVSDGQAASKKVRKSNERMDRPTEVGIPFELISKANLEPRFEAKGRLSGEQRVEAEPGSATRIKERGP